VLLSVIVAILVFATFGVSQGMAMDDMGFMGSCALMGSPAALCPMSAMEHAAAFRGLFAPVPTLFGLFLLLAAMLLLANVPASGLLVHALSPPAAALWALNPNLALYPLLRALFASGILHPRDHA